MTIKLGDRITFRAACRWGAPKLTRVVNGFYQGKPTVRAHGCADFIVYLREIIDVRSK